MTRVAPRRASALAAIGTVFNHAASLTIVIAWLALVEIRDVHVAELGWHGPARATLVTFAVAGIGYLALVGWRGRRLYARWSRRQLQGVCAGLAEYFRVPLWFVRLAFLSTFVAGLGGGTIYVLLAFLVEFHPDDGKHLMWARLQQRWPRRVAS